MRLARALRASYQESPNGVGSLKCPTGMTFPRATPKPRCERALTTREQPLPIPERPLPADEQSADRIASVHHLTTAV
jgi:hypothetical protein